MKNIIVKKGKPYANKEAEIKKSLEAVRRISETTLLTKGGANG